MDTNENLQQINTFTGGMDTDTSDVYVQPNTYRMARNLRLGLADDGKTGELKKIYGTKEQKMFDENGDELQYSRIININSYKDTGVFVCEQTVAETLRPISIAVTITNVLSDTNFERHADFDQQYPDSDNPYVADWSTKNLKYSYTVENPDNIEFDGYIKFTAVCTDIYENTQIDVPCMFLVGNANASNESLNHDIYIATGKELDSQLYDYSLKITSIENIEYEDGRIGFQYESTINTTFETEYDAPYMGRPRNPIQPIYFGTILNQGVYKHIEHNSWSVFRFNINDYICKRIFGPCKTMLQHNSITSYFIQFSERQVVFYIKDSVTREYAIQLFDSRYDSNSFVPPTTIEDIYERASLYLPALGVQLNSGNNARYDIVGSVQYIYVLYNEDADRLSSISIPTKLVIIEPYCQSITLTLPDNLNTNGYDKITIYKILINNTTSIVKKIVEEQDIEIGTFVDTFSGETANLDDVVAQIPQYTVSKTTDNAFIGQTTMKFVANITDSSDSVDDKFVDIDMRAFSTGTYFLKNGIRQYVLQVNKDTDYRAVMQDPIGDIYNDSFNYSTNPFYEFIPNDFKYFYIEGSLKQYNGYGKYIRWRYKRSEQSEYQLQIGETYRFGAILYDEENMPSNVKFIADIQIPDYPYIKDFIGADITDGQCITVEFTLSEKIPNCSRVEIVMCQKTISKDTTRLSTGLLWPVLNIGNALAIHGGGMAYGKAIGSTQYFMFFSPEFQLRDETSVTGDTTQYFVDKLQNKQPFIRIIEPFVPPQNYFYNSGDAFNENMMRSVLNIYGTYSSTRSILQIKDYQHIISPNPSNIQINDNVDVSTDNDIVSFDTKTFYKFGYFTQGYGKAISTDSTSEKTNANCYRSNSIDFSAELFNNVAEYPAGWDFNRYVKSFIDDSDYTHTGAHGGFANGPVGMCSVATGLLVKLENKIPAAPYITEVCIKNTPYGGYTNDKTSSSDYIHINCFLSTQDPVCTIYSCANHFSNYFKIAISYPVATSLTYDGIRPVDKLMVNIGAKYQTLLYHSIYHHGDPAGDYNLAQRGYRIPIMRGRDSIVQQYTYGAYEPAVQWWDNKLPYFATSVKPNKYSSVTRPYRIKWTEYVQGTVEDTFAANDYVELNPKYGEISKIKYYKNRLYFWQKTAFGYLNINEQTLATTSSGLLQLQGSYNFIGEGINVSPVYISTVVGIDNNQCDVCETEKGLYWYSNSSNSIVRYNINSGIDILSEKCNIQQFLLSARASHTQYIIYRPKYQEILFNFLNGQSLVYNENTEKFTGVYDYFAIGYYITNNAVMLYNENYVYQDNYVGSNTIYGKPFDVYLDFVVNNKKQIASVYNNMQISFGNISESSKNDKIRFKFSTNLGQISELESNKITNREFDYRAAIPRAGKYDEDGNFVTAKYGDRMRGKTMEVELKANSSDFTTSIQYIITKYSMSWS